MPFGKHEHNMALNMDALQQALPASVRQLAPLDVDQ